VGLAKALVKLREADKRIIWSRVTVQELIESSRSMENFSRGFFEIQPTLFGEGYGQKGISRLRLAFSFKCQRRKHRENIRYFSKPSYDVAVR
jgi:hypothetical protein